jgi:isocitrate dehydrogenase
MVSKNPTIPCLNGDHPEILETSRAVLDAAVAAAYGGHRRISWMDISDRERVVSAVQQFSVSWTGPVDLDEEIYRTLDLYAHVWPIRYFRGLQTPMKDPERLNVLIFGPTPGETIQAPQRLVRMAIRYALANDCNLVTLVDPDFTNAGYKVACEEFGVQTATEVQVWQNHRGTIPPGKMMINDRSAETLFRQLLLHPAESKILVAPTPVCHYLAGLCAAQAGLAGSAPTAALGDAAGIFHAAWNPFSGVLSGIMMLDYLCWNEATDLLSAALAGTIAGWDIPPGQGRRTANATEMTALEFGAALIENLRSRGSY